ncbi:triple tyrosine motif-containing protein [Neobacillus sp. 179-C4.2 HS]|uniref:Triple tyrosine motif-containing protein n=1 Tax=Neobacillus driksii TaxID=3035913 RepID=A0ABV4YZ16_9BACI
METSHPKSKRGFMKIVIVINKLKLFAISKLAFYDKTESGRVSRGNLEFQFLVKDKFDSTGKLALQNGTITNVITDKIRSYIGTSVMKSNLITATNETSTAFSFAGLGYGHGVGMSQHGANNRVAAGYNYKQVLSFYYPGTTLVKQYELHEENTASPLQINSVTSNSQDSWVGTPITWTVDGEGTALQYAWYVYKGTTKVSTIWYSSSKTLSWTPREAGEYRVTVFAKDSSGKSVSKNSAVIKVTSPINSISANVQDTSMVGTPITWTVDGEGTGVQYAWYVYNGSTRVDIIWYSSSKTLSWTPREAGEYRVTVFAKDSSGRNVSKNSAVIKVTSPLKINSIKADVRTSKVGTPINWTVDGEGTGVKYAWYVYNGNTRVNTIWYSSSQTLEWLRTK